MVERDDLAPAAAPPIRRLLPDPRRPGDLPVPARPGEREGGGVRRRRSLPVHPVLHPCPHPAALADRGRPRHLPRRRRRGGGGGPAPIRPWRPPGPHHPPPPRPLRPG